MVKRKTRNNHSLKRNNRHNKTKKHRKKRKKSRKVSKKPRKGKKKVKKVENNEVKTKKSRKKKGKKKLNAYFTSMLNAKKNDLPSFTYNGKKYVKKQSGHLVVYKKV